VVAARCSREHEEVSVPVVVVGLHERDAPLELSEQVALSEEELPKALAGLGDSPHLSEVVILSTCMRTEVYAVAERFHDGVADIRRFFADRLGAGTAAATLAEALVVDHDEAAVQHLFAVSSGIDSPVLGEGEVLRQVRAAHERARHERASGPVLDGLFRHAVEVGKRARAETGIARGITSLAHVAVALATEHLGGSLAGKRIVVVGAGEMGKGFIGAVPSFGKLADLVVISRSRAKAAALAGAAGGRHVGLGDLGAELARADLLFSATSAPETLLGTEDLRRARATRRRLLIVDAAVPRDVDPAVASFPGVTLRDFDDLRSFAEASMATRRAEIDRVQAIIAEELRRYAFDVQGRSVAPVVSALHERAELIRSAEVARIDAVLARLAEDDRAAVESLTRRIVAKLVYEPTVQVKAAAGSPRGERLAEALQALFGL
jgi:glutamyl-tRNA reductase